MLICRSTKATGKIFIQNKQDLMYIIINIDFVMKVQGKKIIIYLFRNFLWHLTDRLIKSGTFIQFKRLEFIGISYVIRHYKLFSMMGDQLFLISLIRIKTNLLKRYKKYKNKNYKQIIKNFISSIKFHF